jgi:hypothetical protein
MKTVGGATTIGRPRKKDAESSDGNETDAINSALGMTRTLHFREGVSEMLGFYIWCFALSVHKRSASVEGVKDGQVCKMFSM